MLFFENEKVLGLVFWAVAAFFIFDSVLVMLIPFGFIDMEIPIEVADVVLFCVIVGSGRHISALLYAWNAHRVMIGKVSGSVQILSQYVIIVGVTTLIIEVMDAIGEIVCIGSLADGLITMAIGIVFCVVLMLVSYKIGKGKKGPLKKFLWAVLVIAFIIMAVYNVLPVESYEDLIYCTSHLIIAIFMLLFLLDTGVREEMGFKPRRV